MHLDYTSAKHKPFTSLTINYINVIKVVKYTNCIATCQICIAMSIMAMIVYIYTAINVKWYNQQ